MSVSYYPFGLQQKGYNDVVTSNSNSVANRFGYGGKELQEGLGLQMYDFGARLQDPSLGRWFVVDALADQPEQIDKSPYAYGWNNPIFYTDPDGNCPKCWAFLNGIADGFTGHDPNKPLGDQDYVLDTGRQHSNTPREKSDNSSYESGRIFGVVAIVVVEEVVTGGVSPAAEKRIAGTIAEELAEQTTKKADELLLDTNTVISDGKKFVNSGENVVKDQITNIEINDVYNRGKIRGKPAAANQIKDVKSSGSIHARINIRGAIPSSKRGNFADGVIGATAKARDATVVTRDKGFLSALRQNDVKAINSQELLDLLGSFK